MVGYEKVSVTQGIEQNKQKELFKRYTYTSTTTLPNLETLEIPYVPIQKVPNTLDKIKLQNCSSQNISIPYNTYKNKKDIQKKEQHQSFKEQTTISSWDTIELLRPYLWGDKSHMAICSTSGWFLSNVLEQTLRNLLIFLTHMSLYDIYELRTFVVDTVLEHPLVRYQMQSSQSTLSYIFSKKTNSNIPIEKQECTIQSSIYSKEALALYDSIVIDFTKAGYHQYFYPYMPVPPLKDSDNTTSIILPILQQCYNFRYNDNTNKNKNKITIHKYLRNLLQNSNSRNTINFLKKQCCDIQNIKSIYHNIPSLKATMFSTINKNTIITTKHKTKEETGLQTSVGPIKFKEEDRVILMFHGGAFVCGSPNWVQYEDMARRCIRAQHSIDSNISNRNTHILSIDYRLAPENRFPDPLLDAVNAYDAILKSGANPKNTFFMGDSCGANIALSLACIIEDKRLLNIPKPAGIILYCPWTDLHLLNTDSAQLIDSDTILPLNSIYVASKILFGHIPPNDPLFDANSTLYTTFSRFLSTIRRSQTPSPNDDIVSQNILSSTTQYTCKDASKGFFAFAQRYPLASPANFPSSLIRKLPPMCILSGGNEQLLHSAAALFQQASQDEPIPDIYILQNNAIVMKNQRDDRFIIYPGLFHNFNLFPILPEAYDADIRVANFILNNS